MQNEDVNKHEVWRQHTITVLIHLRREAIRSGTKPIKAWDQLSDRTFLATRTASSVAGWLSKIMETMRIPIPARETGAALVDLEGIVAPADFQEWLSMIEEQHAFLFAAARARIDARKAELAQVSTELDALADASKPKPKRTRKPAEPVTERKNGELL